MAVDCSSVSIAHHQLNDPEEAEMYFTDRLSAPASSFVPPPEPVETDSSGYLPDRK